MRNPGLFTSIVCALIFLLMLQASCTRSRLASVSPALHAELALPVPQPQPAYHLSDAASVVSSDTLAYSSDTDFVSLQGREHARSGTPSVLLHPKTLLKKAMDLRVAHAAMKRQAQMPGQNKSRIGTSFFFWGLAATVLGVGLSVGTEALGVVILLVGLIAVFVGLLFWFWWLMSEWNSPTMPYNTTGKIGLLLFLLPLLIAFGLFFLTFVFYFGDALAIAVLGLLVFGIGLTLSLIGLIVMLIGRATEGGEPAGQGQK